MRIVHFILEAKIPDKLAEKIAKEKHLLYDDKKPALSLETKTGKRYYFYAKSCVLKGNR